MNQVEDTCLVCGAVGCEGHNTEEPTPVQDEPVIQVEEENKEVEGIRPEITSSNVIENTEDTKEVTSILSEFMVRMENMFTKFFSKPEAEVVTSPTPEQSLSEDNQVEETNVEENKPELEVVAPTPEVDNAVAQEKEALEAQLKAMEDAKAELEAQVAALSEKAAAFEAEKMAVERAAKEKQLSDEIEALTEAGLVPTVAEKVRNLISSNETSVIALSEGQELSFGDALLDLVKEILKPESRVELDQVGASADTAILSDDAENPWAAEIAKYKQAQ